MSAAVDPSEDGLNDLIEALHGGARLRVWSLVVTVFGDAILPRGGRVGLAALQEVMARLRVEPGAVRTALSRLAKDGWVLRERDGRNAYYRLAEQGRHAFDRATRRIYASGPPAWDGLWTTVLLPGTGQIGGRALDAGAPLVDAGLVTTGAGWIRPELANAAPLPALPAGALVLTGQAVPGSGVPSWLWQLDEINSAYEALDRLLAPLAERAERSSPDPLSALATRIVVNHLWRRIVLRDPGLPAALLPADWRGERARATVRTLYSALTPASEAWLDAAGLPPVSDPSRMSARFGGI